MNLCEMRNCSFYINEECLYEGEICLHQEGKEDDREPITPAGGRVSHEEYRKGYKLHRKLHREPPCSSREGERR